LIGQRRAWHDHPVFLRARHGGPVVAPGDSGQSSRPVIPGIHSG
jgi:hypothetical protein